jgi:peroxin-13
MYSPYGGGYGGYGSYGSYGSYGFNRIGEVPGSSFARVAEENSRPAFQSIESIVHAVSSVAMMLDSSFQAVYSSFRAVIGVADNFSRLKTQLVKIVSALALIRTLRYLVRRFLEILRLRPAGTADREWQEALFEAAGSAAAGGDGEPKKSAWPILMFFGIILGGPWLIWKLISSFSDSQGLCFCVGFWFVCQWFPIPCTTHLL